MFSAVSLLLLSLSPSALAFADVPYNTYLAQQTLLEIKDARSAIALEVVQRFKNRRTVDLVVNNTGLTEPGVFKPEWRHLFMDVVHAVQGWNCTDPHPKMDNSDVISCTLPESELLTNPDFVYTYCYPEESYCSFLIKPRQVRSHTDLSNLISARFVPGKNKTLVSTYYVGPFSLKLAAAAYAKAMNTTCKSLLGSWSTFQCDRIYGKYTSAYCFEKVPAKGGHCVVETH